ncbi:MAG: hypothetical protein RL172_2956 [Bacteroidota bacterium]|jgi:uncharacterized protein (TIGR02453 family)
MLQPSTLNFLKNLKKNNNKAWFDANRKSYEAAKADFAGLTTAIIEATSKFDASTSNLIAKDCLFRINRDVRFSKDKSPYKTNMGAYINPGGKKSDTPGYYLQCEPGQNFAAGGLYTPMPAVLARVRQELDYNFEEWNKIICSKAFKKYFTAVDGIDVLSRPPKGYTEDNPAIEFLKMKSYIASRPFTDADMVSKTLVKNVASTFEAMKPMIDFLNHAMQ